jgi:HJR/Mrr/RecB family endonuclease
MRRPLLSLDQEQFFLNRYMHDRPEIAFFYYPPCEERFHISLEIWERLYVENRFKNIIIVTQNEILRNIWNVWLNLRKLRPRPVNKHLFIRSIDQLQDMSPQDMQATFAGGSTLAILDEIDLSTYWKGVHFLFHNKYVLSANYSQTLCLTSKMDEKYNNIPHNYTRTIEYIYNTNFFQLEIVRRNIARFSPSQEVLQSLWAKHLSIDSLSWRQFEKLVAELLCTDGYTINTIKGTKDGGIDVVAFKNDGISGYFKTVWQAKKYSKNKVGLHLIRELADSVHEFNASKGIIVTTSFLTADALQRVHRDRYTLGKVDRTDLQSWVSRILSDT